MNRMEQLLVFCDWERKNNPSPTGAPHIAEWAAAEIERLTAEKKILRERHRFDLDEYGRLSGERDALSEELRVEKLNHGYLRDEFDELHTNAIERLRQLQASIKERDAHQRAAAWCDKHKPDGGARGQCVICAGQKLSSALSRISYLCGAPNEMECGTYDVFPDEDAVVAQVQALITERDALRLDAERYRKWRADYANTSTIPTNLGIALADTWTEDAIDAAIDAAMSKGTK